MTATARIAGTGPARPGPEAVGRGGVLTELLAGLSDEQRRVVTAPMAPLLVRAGAGSGKTHTMAIRMARHLVAADAGPSLDPAAVLGLTFTRKAAGELGARLHATAADVLLRLGSEPLRLASLPVVGTYHAFAGRVVTEFGPHAGLDPDAVLLGDAAAAQFADAVVRDWRGPLDVDLAPATVADRIRCLAAECAEHDVHPDDVADVLDDALGTLEAIRVAHALPPSTIATHVRHLRTRRALIPLVRAFAERKAASGAMDHGDRVIAALRLVEMPPVAEQLRRRHRVVLLDEYQDTSTAQGRLLATVFGNGHPVTAVGDPNQAIFGWRGAGAGTLDRFLELFRAPDGRPPRVEHLTETRRNPRRVLAVANAVAEPLRGPAAGPGGVTLLRSMPDAPGGSVHIAWTADAADEARQVRDWVVRHRRPGRTQAVLCRVRASIDVIREALTQAGLPITIVGLGGLLDEPVVAETLAVLGAAHDPRRPAALLRLLTSPRWAVSPRDLDALADLAKRTGALAGGLAEAVTTTAGHRPVGGPPSAVLSPSARAAVHEVVGLLTAVRTAAARLPLPDLVREAARLSGADVEAAVWASDPRHPARVLDRFVSVAADFAATIGPVTRSTTGGDQVGGFIGWLEAARVHEWGLETVDVDPDPAAVQILTVHAAKGLEWDDVAVVDLAEDAFPARPRACHWLGGEAVLPWPVRGDREALPEWPGYPAGDLTDYAASWRRFLDAAQDRALAEERRLAYVAVTRARENLLLTGSAWRSGRSTARTPSPFLQDARGVAGVIVREWADRGERPIGDDLPETDWPVVLAASGRARLEEASGRVRAALSDDPPPDVPSGPGSAWDALVASLLAARVRPPRRLQARHLSVSALVRAAEDVQDAVLDVVRPVPVAPDARTDRGSRFHHWVERRLCGGALLDLDDVPGAADGDVDDDELIRSFQARFDASPWSRARVIGVEVPFDLPLAVGDQLIRIRGRVDAVMAREGGRYDVVDWKTGHEPTGARARAAALQLAVYRMAVARRLAVPVGDVGAAFWYARTGRTVWADMDLGTDAITELLVKVYAVEVTGSPSACRPSS